MADNAQQQSPANTPELPTRYAPAEVEGKLYERWVDKGYFAAEAKSPRTPSSSRRRTSPARSLPPTSTEFTVNRPAQLMTALLTASAALLLTSCSSGGGEDSASDEIKGADQGGGKASVEASASASASPGGAGRPEIKLPDSFQMNFEGWTNSDPKLQAIMDDGREQLRGDHAAIIDGDPDAGYVQFYNGDASLQASQKWIKQYVADGLTLVGEIRVFDPQVRINDSGSGVLFYCVDEGEAFTENRKTGEKKGTPAGDSPRLQYRTLLEKSPQGVWKTTRAQTERGAC